jgi:CubicO group peptidase (beta-lactamase class C family)
MADLDTTVEEGAISLDLKVARILSEAVAATWKVHRLREILSTTSWVPG